MSNTIQAKVTYENRVTGLRTLAITAEDAAIIEAWLNSRGQTLRDTARRCRINKKGRATFAAGGGYAIIDADLLGGNGDGSAERAFEEATGYVIRY